ncbi:hypothetical protein J4Q44_G00104910 [Coregonus suidteri]|uniref:Uncharacterized protein n=1 Tax=Coregonus suidteri TaxID=861788 RepID=A0AAN8QWJ2_9TELE
MTTGRTPAETRLDLEDIEEQEETPLWVPPLGIPPGRHTAEGLLEEVVEVEAEEPAQEEDSTHSDTRLLVKDRDPRGVNKCLKADHALYAALPDQHALGSDCVGQCIGHRHRPVL